MKVSLPSRKLQFPVEIVLVISVCLFGISCSDSSNSPGDSASETNGKPIVYASNYPLTYFAERIAGDAVEVRFPASEEGDPAFWKPTDEVLQSMQNADLILLNGATYEKWLGQVSLPDKTKIDTSSAFKGEFLSSGEMVTHSHGNDDEHSHGGTAFTTWMDFQQAIWQAEEVCNGLVLLVPDRESEFRAAFETLADDIDALHQSFKQVGKKIEGVPLMASHPVYQYFARRYGLDIESVLWEPETVPDDKAINQLKEKLKEHPAKWMIWEGEPAQESVELLSGMGIKSVVVAPCGNRPEEGDWLSTMQDNIQNLSGITP
ncbi:MAG: metal ABC transporter substrate-binding protein [Verrucomicrobiales bacterium]|nr:metal ABC transporter substrate-binding protein [Verrucomicrobiales bacterium]